MNARIAALVLAAGLLVGVPASVSAETGQPGATQVSTDDAKAHGKAFVERRREMVQRRYGKKIHKPERGEQIPEQVPELDPNAAGLSLALLIGGALILSDRRRLRRA